MALRFRKRIKVANGVYINVTGDGISSASVAVKGHAVNVKQGRTTQTISVPGSGFAYQEVPKVLVATQHPASKQSVKESRLFLVLLVLAMVLIAAAMMAIASAATPIIEEARDSATSPRLE